MKRILVTGGFGFIGGHLVHRLVQDADVIVQVVDDLSSSPIPLETLLGELDHPKNLDYEICSVEQYCCDNQNVRYDEIYHLASPVGPALVLKHTGWMIKSVVVDCYALMAMAIRSKAKLIDISTSEVYGGGRDGLCSEQHPKIIAPVATSRLEYAVGKLAAETAILNMCKVTDLRAAIVRPFNVVGPRQSGQGGFVLPRFIYQAMTNRRLTVFGEGTQIRAFTHVKDIVDGIVRVAQYGRRGQTYDLGNPDNKVSIIDLARHVLSVVNKQGDVEFVDPNEIYGPLYAEANDKYPVAKKANTELDWAPSRDIDICIKDTHQYMSNTNVAVFCSLGGT